MTDDALAAIAQMRAKALARSIEISLYHIAFGHFGVDTEASKELQSMTEKLTDSLK